MRNIELLVPASSLEVLKIAVVFGADAVYIGGEAFGLRAKAKNFSHEDMAEGIAFAHEHGVKVYVTVNILAHNDDLPGVREYLQELKELKPDALIDLTVKLTGNLNQLRNWARFKSCRQVNSDWFFNHNKSSSFIRSSSAISLNFLSR